jgi:hypothetical protein
LEKAGPLRGLVAAIKYAIPRRAFSQDENPGSIESLWEPDLVDKPYLWKRIGYEFEKEIRFAFGVNQD